MPEHFPITADDGAESLRVIKQMYSQRERELAAALRISEALFQRMKLQDLIEHALRTTLDLLDAENGSLLLADAEKEQLAFYHSIGDKPVPHGTVIPWARGIAGAVFQSGKAEVVRDAQQDPRYLAEIDLLCGSVTHDMITIPLKTWEGNPIGVVQVMNKRLGRLDEQDLGILTIICALSAMAIEQARLFEHTKRTELAQERTLALTESQARLRALLHDHLGQTLVVGKMKLSQARELSGLMPRCQGLLNEVDQALTQSLTYTRTLMVDLAPPALRDLGLLGGLRWLVEQMRHYGLAVSLHTSLGQLHLPEHQTIVLFQSIRELLMNVVKHAQSAEATVSLDKDMGTLWLEVRDHGIGFDPVDVKKEDFSKFGLFSIGEHMHALGGTFEEESTPGHGTVARLTLPVHETHVG
ncbi:MAG TPA: GAF domain-containing protein [Nitrospira sp.]|nr:GAF domain-containing protein [Nitrospira sp.]